ncbi:hypothetical protein [Nocardioides salarius]|uniref:hypothetical protein n=1 Tax=Nocardioides salarius TaxID=374513 RepID=UPI0030FCA814
MGVNLSGGAPTTPGAPGGILQAIHDGIGGIGDALAEGLNGIIRGLIDMVLGRYDGDFPPFVDGQLALNERFDLLGTSAYCAAYMYNNLRLGPGRNRALPFDSQIGPNQDAELVQVSRTHPEDGSGSATRQEWCIRLDRAGLWHANASFVHAGDGFDRAQGEIVVLNPDLTPYSYTTLPAPRPHADGGTVTDVNVGAPVSLSKFFVTPAPGYYVQVRWRFNVLVGIRTVKGGARLSQFSVVQWSDDIDNAATNDDPSGTIDDT